MKVVDFISPGGPDVLYVREGKDPVVKDNEVLIKIAAVGVCDDDLCRREGNYRVQASLSPYLGHECSGTVIATGSNVLRIKIGDKVCAILKCGGGYAELVSVLEIHVIRIPSTLSFLEAAALPQSTCLMIQTLRVLRQVSCGKKILIHGAAGGVGTIALQYATFMGCEVFAVAGTPEKLETCKTLGAKICINYKKEDFCKCVMAATAGKGVDIIMDVSGKYNFRKNLDSLAMHGMLILIGMKSGHEVDLDLSLLAKKDIEILGANLRSLPPEELGFLLREAETFIWPIVDNGDIKPIIAGIFRFSEAADAHRAMQKASAAGKVILTPDKQQNE